MTVGEKIQLYRKNIGMSQEDLGQRLLVSRQTVSLWEMDKTMPSVDNLIRLKEIFEVSLDDILTDSQEKIEELPKEPSERYVFEYTKKDVTYIFRKSMVSSNKGYLWFLLSWVVIYFTSPNSKSADSVGFIWGLIFSQVVLIIASLARSINYYKAAKPRLLASTYSIEAYDDYISIAISRDNQVKELLNIRFDEIKGMLLWGNFFEIQYLDHLYPVKRDILIQNSVFYSLYEKSQAKKERKAPKGALKLISIILPIVSVASIWVSWMCVVSPLGVNFGLNELSQRMWIFLLFIPIPIASILLGFYLKKKGFKYLLNIIVGIIILLVLCLYGFSKYDHLDPYTHDDKHINYTEELLQIDIPDHDRIDTLTTTEEDQEQEWGELYCLSDVYFDKNVAEAFEKQLENDDKWMSKVPGNMVDIMSFYYRTNLFDYYIVYNIDTQEINKLPEEYGTYRFINVMYCCFTDTMMIVEYEIEYQNFEY